jgi:hypothetical protein
MTFSQAKANASREARARRLAFRKGFRLAKSRGGYNAGTFGIVDLDTNGLVAGDHQFGFGLSIEDVEEWLAQ